MDLNSILPLLTSLLNGGNAPMPALNNMQQPNMTNVTNIPTSVLNTYPQYSIDTGANAVNPQASQNMPTSQNMQNSVQNVVSNNLPTQNTQSNPLNNLLSMLGGGKLDTNNPLELLSKLSPMLNKGQKNSPKIGEYIAVDDYVFD